MQKASDLEIQIRGDVLTEIIRAAKLPDKKWLREVVRPLVKAPVNRFAGYIAKFDRTVRESGFPAASREILNVLIGDVIAMGQASIPAEGPLILASNHPGTYDGLAIISNLPRNDFRLMVSDIPFFKNLPNASKNLIFTTHDISQRMEVIRQSIRHLRNGGALLIFPSGRLDPDPSIYPDAGKGLARWSRSIDVFMDKVPEARLVLIITSGVISRDLITHPLLKLFKDDHERRRIMEFMQAIRQLVLNKPATLHPKVSFAQPMTFDEYDAARQVNNLTLILEKARVLLENHRQTFYAKK